MAETLTLFEDDMRDPEMRRLIARETLVGEFQELVQAAMEKQKVTRTELARRMGCSTAHITQTMRGTRNLTAATMADMANALGLKVCLGLRVDPWCPLPDADGGAK